MKEKDFNFNFTAKVFVFLFILVLVCALQVDSSINESNTTEELHQYDTMTGQEESDYCPSGCPDPYDTITEYELDIKKDSEIESNLMNSGVEPSVGPVLHYTFDDTPEDATGSYDGVIVGEVSAVDGKIGKAYSFNGFDSYIDVNWDAPIQGEDQSFTIGAWIKPDDINSELYIFRDFSGYNHFRFALSEGKITLIWRYNGFGSTLKLSHQFPLEEGFNHVAVTYDSESRELYIFSNGVLLAKNIETRPLGVTDIDHPYIGKGYGIIDDVRVYDYALSSEEIVYLVISGDNEEPGTPPNLTAKTVSQTRIDLNWDAASDDISVVGYKIYRNDELIATTSETQYSDIELTADTTYNYIVTAYDLAGNESSKDSYIAGKTFAEGECWKTDRIEQYGITWIFDKEYGFGRYANGDYWVKTDEITGTVVIENITPEYDGTLNGWQVNPQPVAEHGLDGRLGSFNPDLVPSLPYHAQGDESILKAVSKLEVSGYTHLETAAVLTVVDEVPPGNGLEVFRPPYIETDKIDYFVDDLRTDLLPDDYAPVEETPSLDGFPNIYRVQMNHVPGGLTQYIHPEKNLRGYNPAVNAVNSTIALRLMMDDPLEEKMPLLIAYVQGGLDYYHFTQEGMLWPRGGGEQAGNMLPIVFFAAMLGDEIIQENVGKLKLYDDYMTFYGSNRQILWGDFGWQYGHSVKDYWRSIAYDGTTRTIADPYGYIDGGKLPGGSYQFCCTSQPFKGTSLCLLLMPALRDIWYPKSLIAYSDRWVEDGTWTQPDPCAPAEAGVIVGGPRAGQPCGQDKELEEGEECKLNSNYGKTYGPDPDNPGMCIFDEDPSDGIGRFPDRHGTRADDGGYQSGLVNAMWDVYRNTAAPSIIKHPTSKSVNIGDSVTFEVIANDNPANTFQWKFNGAELEGETSNILTLEEIQSGNIGVYTVEVRNDEYSITSMDAILTLGDTDEPYPPYIIEQPVSQAVKMGSDVTFTVSASANPVPDYQWMKDGQGLNGETGDILTLNNVQLADAGEYSVVISNAEGNITSDLALLTVVETPPRVSNLSVIAEYFNTYLSWDKPDNQSNWEGIKVVRKQDGKPADYNDGEEIYNGQGNSAVDKNSSEGNYYYAIYTYREVNSSRVYSEPVFSDQITIPQSFDNKIVKIQANPETGMRIGQNTRGDLYSLWNTETNIIGKGPGGNGTDLWLYYDLIGSGEKQVAENSAIVSARLVFNVEDFEDLSFSNSKSDSDSDNSDDNSNENIDKKYGNIPHSIMVYRITDPDGLGMPYYAKESGLNAGLDFNYRDHRPGINQAWLLPVVEDIDESNILNLLEGMDPVDRIEFYPEIFVDGTVDTIQFDITDTVQAWADGEVEQGLFITIGQGWNNGDSLELCGLSTEQGLTQSDKRPYLEVIYRNSGEEVTGPEIIQQLSITPDTSSINLDWSNPADTDIAGIKILRREGIVPFNSQDGEIVAILTGSNYQEIPESFTDSGLTTGKNYYYALYTYDDQHNYSEKVWIKATPGSPTVVQDFTVTDNGE
ncbi:MAG: immunoglobulin domain-containing protein, partial [Halanaerobiales bacterium]